MDTEGVDISNVQARFVNSGDRALVVEFGDVVDRALNDRVLALDAHLKSAAIPGVVETVPTFRSLMVHYDPLRTGAADLTRTIEGLLGSVGALDRQPRTWRFPVCYEGECAPDLEDVAKRTGLTPDRVVALHNAATYHVYMIGFLPGFPYMGDIAEELRLPRRENPRVRVPRGSVAIAMNQTAIYALESPGGWHLIGTTPVRLFDLTRDDPALLAAGDKVVFDPVDAKTFAEMRAAADAGKLDIRPEAKGAAS